MPCPWLASAAAHARDAASYTAELTDAPRREAAIQTRLDALESVESEVENLDSLSRDDLEVERLVNEPTAASLAYGLDRLGQELKIAVIDFGGGTLDVTVMDFGQGVFEVRATSGDTQLGGGPTRMPIVREFIKEIFGREAETGVDPMECVAQGAAIQADVIGGEVGDIVLVDVTPLTLGIETLGGVATTLISRNSPVPVKHTEVFTTASDMQTAVTVHVFQGERPMAGDNTSLGEFNLTGLAPAPRGVPKIDVTFDIDATCYQGEKMLADFEDKLDQAAKERIEAAIKPLKDAVAAKNADEATAKAEELSKALQDVGAALYAQAEGAQAQASQPYSVSSGTRMKPRSGMPFAS